MAAPIEVKNTKPFLKWPGGKFRQVDKLKQALGSGRRLIEPFVGAGSVFLNCRYSAYLLGDNNDDLINLYRQLIKGREEFIDFVGDFFNPEANTKDAYYAFRALFNATSDKRLRAALLVYLNRHAYNGLFRRNLSGGFNVPFGKYKNPGFPGVAMRRFVEKTASAEFIVADFRDIMARAERGDVCYCDPPYAPINATSNFTAYSPGGFSWSDQEDLAECAQSLAHRGVRVVLTNHDTPDVRRLYRRAKVSANQVRRSISRKGNQRIEVGEVIAIFAAK